MALLGLFTLASGLLQIPVMIVALVLRYRAQPFSRRILGACIASLSLVFCLGLALHVHFAGHDPLRAQGVRQFLGALGVVLSWPFPDLSLATPLIWLPSVLGCIRVALGRDSRAWSIAAVAVVLWVGLQAAATAYSRGHDMVDLSSRYTDVFQIGWWVNCLFLTDYVIRRVRARGMDVFGATGAATLIALVMIAYGARAQNGISMLNQRASELQAQRTNLLGYLTDHDIGHLRDKPFLHIPYPDPDRLRGFVDDPTIAAMLRPSLFLAPTTPVGAAVAASPDMGIASRLGRYLIDMRFRIGLLSGLLLLFGLSRLRRPSGQVTRPAC